MKFLLEAMGKITAIGFAFLCLALPLMAQDKEAYIREYQDIAVTEMHRTGIPASIKLAQGILESNCGTSELAKQANNHFGIKCGGDWTGGSYHKEDDDYLDGALVPSCFRTFGSARECFVAHSEFLADPRKANRYGSLFALEATDYRGWANGLSRAGYATDPRYAERLIRLIEDYQLYRFDQAVPAVVAADRDVQMPAAKPASPGIQRRYLRRANGVSYMTALAGDHLEDIARASKKPMADLIRNNDGIYTASTVLQAGSRVYLEAKKTAYKGTAKVHSAKPGERLADIAQHYGVSLSALSKRNGLAPGQPPVPGQKIYLRGRPRKSRQPAASNRPPSTAPRPGPVGTEPTVMAIPAVKSSAHGPSASGTGRPVEDGVVSQNQPAGEREEANMHLVTKGDTLYGIARTYGLSVDELKKKNNLSADTIIIGQYLTVK